VRNPTLHAVLEAFASDAAAGLKAAADGGDEVPFELVAEPGGGSPLYCYRPLTGRFIGERRRLLSGLASWAPAVRALSTLEGTEAYLRARGLARVPADPRARAEEALRELLRRIYTDRSDFAFDAARFAAAYGELELALYEGRRTTTVVTPVLGLALDHATRELMLGDGLTLVRGDLVPGVPSEAVWGGGSEPYVLASFTATRERGDVSALPAARTAFRRLLTTLRLFERGGFAVGALGWAREDGGEWRPIPLGSHGRARSITFLSAVHEDELRAFHSLLARRTPSTGELPWALARYEMACERGRVTEALTDHLLALRALLEPEGPASGRLAGRLAAVCAVPEERAKLTARVLAAIALEREIIAGLAPAQTNVEAVVSELGECLRAILRDVLCGHLSGDLCGLADELLADEVPSPPAGAAVFGAPLT
jgi:hypothetical protein